MEIIHGFMNRNNLNFSKVWVLSGNDGKPVSGWPFRVGNSHSALPLVMQLDGKGALDFVSTHVQTFNYIMRSRIFLRRDI